MTVLTRASKGSQLTWAEVDENFTTLRDVAAQTSGTLNGVVIGGVTPAAFSATTGAFSNILTVTMSSSGASPDALAGIVLNENDNTALQFLTPNNKTAYILFGDPQSATRGRVSYDHSTDTLNLFAGGSSIVDVNASGMNGVLGATTPAALSATTVTVGTPPFNLGVIRADVATAGDTHVANFTNSHGASKTGLYIRVNSDTPGVYLNADGSDGAPMYLQVGASTIATVSSTGLAVTGTLAASGNVGIGIAATTSALRVDSVTGNVNGIYVSHPDTAEDVISVQNSATSGDNVFITFYTEASPTSRGSISYNRGGGVTAYNTTSARERKIVHGAADLQKSRQIVLATPLREYSWKENPAKRQIGVIADEVLAAGFRGAVQRNRYGGAEGVDKTAWVFHSIGTLQLHDADIQSALSRLAKLEAAAAAAGWAV